jgi:hypothetical protein
MTIQKIAPCALKPRIVNGHLHGYDWWRKRDNDSWHSGIAS